MGRVGDVVDLEAGAHGPDEGVVVDLAAQIGARLQLDVGADDAAHVGGVKDISISPCGHPRRGDELTGEWNIPDRVGPVATGCLRDGEGGGEGHGDGEHQEARPRRKPSLFFGGAASAGHGRTCPRPDDFETA